MQEHPLAIRLSDKGMRILRFPLTRFLIAILFFVVFTGVGMGLGKLIAGWFPPAYATIGEIIRLVLVCGSAWICYVFYCATIEGRKVHELDMRLAVSQTGFGLAMGFFFISVIMLVMWIAGGYRVDGFNSFGVIWPVLAMSVQAGIVEEIVSRGIIFRIIEEAAGTWLSVAFSALLFGFAHIWNPNATVFSSVSIALTAGVILAMLYVITRQLWVPIGLHIGWNFTLGAIYGAPVSGGEAAGLLKASFSGPDWLTGGPFGPEASVITVGVFLVLGVYLIMRSNKEKSWVKPMWRR